MNPVTLTLTTGPQAGRRIDVEKQVLLGRADDCDLTLPDKNVSRRHASLKPLPGGKVELRDLGSANGTFVDGERVDEAVLTGGEQLQVGDTVIHVFGDTALEDDSRTTVKAIRTGGNGDGVSARPTDSAVVRALRRASVIQQLRTDSVVARLVVEPELKRARRMALGAIAAAVVVAGALAFGVVGGKDKPVDAAVAKAVPSTVFVSAQRDGQPGPSGSGWVYDAKRGLIVTNAHVVNDGQTFQVGLNGKLQTAKVVGVAPCEDLAVLKVAGTAGMQTLSLGAQSALNLGQTVVAVGFPKSASADANVTSTVGVVSVAQTSYREEALDIPNYKNVVQTDAAINPGNSGGPLIDLDGRLVGVNAAGRTLGPEGRIVQGQSYAIGVDRVKQVVPKLANGQSLGWTGANLTYPAADKLAARGLPTGVFIDAAVQGTPAADAGLGAESSLLTAVNGKPIGNTLASYCAAVEGIGSGQTARFDVIRPGTRKPVPVRVKFA